MEYFKIHKSGGSIVSCIKEIPEDAQGIVIAIHGFSSSKECGTYQMLLRRLPAAAYGMIGIDLPGHGTEESAQETLRIEACKDSIAAAEAYAAEHFSSLPICYFASSFGAYITGLYVSSRKHRGRKAFFRSAAVNMPTLFVKEHPSEADRRILEDLEKKGWFDAHVDFGNSVRITREMYHDLETNDLFQLFDPEAFGGISVRMAHGAEDRVIDPKAAMKFAETFRIPITVFENEGHSLAEHPDTPDRVADLAISFYEKG